MTRPDPRLLVSSNLTPDAQARAVARVVLAEVSRG